MAPALCLPARLAAARGRGVGVRKPGHGVSALLLSPGLVLLNYGMICFSNLQCCLLERCPFLIQRKEDVCFNRFEFYHLAYLHQSLIIINYGPNK